MAVDKWDIVPATLQKVRKWAGYKTLRDFAEEVFSTPAPSSAASSDQKKFEKKLQLLEAFESGADKPTLDVLEKIAKACDQTTSIFLLPSASVDLPAWPTDFRRGVALTERPSKEQAGEQGSGRHSNADDSRSSLPHGQSSGQSEEEGSGHHPIKQAGEQGSGRHSNEEQAVKDSRYLRFIRQTLTRHRFASYYVKTLNPNYRASFLDFEKGDTSTLQARVERALALVQKMESDLQLPLKEWRNQKINERYTELKNKIEQKNILLFTTGDQRNPQNRIPFSLFKGFAIYDRFAPLIAINTASVSIVDAQVIAPTDKKAKKAIKEIIPAEMIFTLVHELAHLYIFRDGGVVSVGQPSDDQYPKDYRAQWDDELFCNMVAEEFILPKDKFDDLWDPPKLSISNVQGWVDYINDLAKKHKISHWVLLYRAYHLGGFSNNEAQAKEIFDSVRKIFFMNSRAYATWKAKEQAQAAMKRKEKREEKKQLASEEEKTEADNEEKTEEDKSRDSAKMHVEAYGIVMCKLALSAYSASEIDSLSLKSMLNITKREDISSLQQKVF